MSESNQSKSNRGGKRVGAGRKPGSVTKKTREIADKAMRDGVTPLEVMLEAMREAYRDSGAKAAFVYAKDAAPYLHPRISATELSGPGGGPLMPTTILICGPDEE